MRKKLMDNNWYWVKKVVSQHLRLPVAVSRIQLDLELLKVAIGRIEGRQLQNQSSPNLQDYEFKAFSQWGEDGILQFLIHHIPIKNRIFVEFGVENYTESNTRFLLQQNNWSGFVMDGSPKHIEYIKNDRIYWQYNLKAECAFITRENINELILKNGISGEIGLLSIDIDGNDYWIWQAIDVIQPAIVVIEYNHRFGTEKAVSTPYDPSFVRTKAHFSNIYYGLSLRAAYLLGQAKGYSFVGCNSAGNNAFFVRSDLVSKDINVCTVEQGFSQAKFRESRNSEGELSFLSLEEEQALLFALPLVDVTVEYL